MVLIVCGLRFDRPDPNNPRYSLLEVDFYGNIPYAKLAEGMMPHRLSLRKNLEKGKFEVYRRYFLTGALGKEEVAFEGSLEEALAFANREVQFIWNTNFEPDRPCKHEEPEMALDCPLKNKSRKAMQW